MRVGLVSCVKLKLQSSAPAQELYSSPLFRGARRYVETSCDRWFILSAKHGLVDPDTVLAPYEQTLTTMAAAKRRAWSDAVLRSLVKEFPTFGCIVFETHAGSAYLNYGLVAGLEARGATVESPVTGLGIGERLRFYKRERLAT